MQPRPHVMFTLAFYIACLAFAAVTSVATMTGATLDMAILRGVQAFAAFIFVGWVAESIVVSSPPPRKAREEEKVVESTPGASELAPAEDAAPENVPIAMPEAVALQAQDDEANAPIPLPSGGRDEDWQADSSAKQAA